jgi:hypothetical protein
MFAVGEVGEWPIAEAHSGDTLPRDSNDPSPIFGRTPHPHR